MTERHALLTEAELADLREIDRLLHEANDHALLESGGGGKSAEGQITLDLGNHWDRIISDDELRRPVGVSIFAYLIGPHRDHYFDSTAQALEVVRRWHHNEMHPDDELPDLYLEIEDERHQRFEAAMKAMDEAFGEED